MGNCLKGLVRKSGCCKKGKTNVGNGEETSNSTLNEWIRNVDAVKDAGNIDEFIQIIKDRLEFEKSKQQNKRDNGSATVIEKIKENGTMWTSFAKRGCELLKFCNDHILENSDKEGLGEATKVAIDLLQQLGQAHWVVGGFSMIAYLLSKIQKMSENRNECLELLGYMLALAGHIIKLSKRMPHEVENFRKAILLIFEASITCASQLGSNKFSRFLKSALNSNVLSSIRRKVNELYPDLELTALIGIVEQMPSYLPIRKLAYPKNAVGIERPVDEVLDLLKRTTDMSSVAVVIYGFGGIGKTTLAEAVVANMDLSHYNYTRIEICQETGRNDLKILQQQILQDCFPTYKGGGLILLRDCADGRSQLEEAFKCNRSKPIFVFIDNGSRSLLLKDLFPKDWGGLPLGSRFLVTTRNRRATEMFKTTTGLCRVEYEVGNLGEKDAMEVLFKLDPTNRGMIQDGVLKRILSICNGIPLALEIVGAQLHKQQYRVDSRFDLLESLERGDQITEENLSQRIVGYVYGELEAYSKEAFLDICSFFNNWRRRDVEYVAGAGVIASLLEAGLITSRVKCNDPKSDDIMFVEDERLFVHDIILAIGRSMARSSRITDVVSLSRAADREELDKIKGVWLKDESQTKVYEITEKHLNDLTKSLRVLALGDKIKISGVSQMTFEELRFLRIGGGISHLPVKLDAIHKLGVFHGPIVIESGSLYNKLPKNLLAVKAMQESHYYNEFPNSETTQALQCCSLEELVFTGSCKLQKLPEGLHQLVALEILILDNFIQMQEFPEQVCHLRSLRRLSITSWKCLKCLPETFGQLTALSHLQLSHCRQLKELPSTFGELRALKYLNLGFCINLKTLPPNFGQLTALSLVNLTGCDAGFRTNVRQISRAVNCIGCEDIE